MKIVIEKHTTYKEDVAYVHYRVRHKLKWYTPWRYVMHMYTHADPDVEEFTSLAEAKKVAKRIRERYSCLRDTVQLLNEDGEPLEIYCGG